MRLSDKQAATKPLGKSRDNWRKHHLGVININVLFLISSHCTESIFYRSLTAPTLPIPTYTWLLKHISSDKSLPWLYISSVNPFFSSIFKSRNSHSTTHLTLRGHNLTLALWTVWKRMQIKDLWLLQRAWSFSRLFDCTFCRCQSLRMTKSTLRHPFSVRAGHI